MRQIKKNIMRPLAVALILGFGAQSGHAGGIPVIDGALLGNNSMDFMSNVGEFAEQAQRWGETIEQWKTELEQWEKDYKVATEGFDVMNDLMSIGNSAGSVMDFAGDLQKTVKNIEDKGLEGISSDLFRSVRNGIYANRSAEITNSCGRRDTYIDQLNKIEKKITEHEDNALKDSENIAKKSTADDNSATKAVGVQTGTDLKRDTEFTVYKRNQRLRDKLIAGIQEADSLCISSLQKEEREAAAKGAYNVDGDGLSFGNSNGLSAIPMI